MKLGYRSKAKLIRYQSFSLLLCCLVLGCCATAAEPAIGVGLNTLRDDVGEMLEKTPSNHWRQQVEALAAAGPDEQQKTTEPQP